MTTPFQLNGADINVCSPSPSIHLTPIVQVLNQILASHNENFIRYSLPNSKMLIDTKVVTEHLISHPKLKEFNVVADMTQPPRNGTTATLGGKLKDDPISFSREVDKLYLQINQILDSLPPQLLQNLTLPTAEDYLKQLSLSMVGNLSLVPKKQNTVKIQPVAFRKSDDVGQSATQNLARVIYAKETIDAEHWLDTFKEGISTWMFHKQYDEETIDSILDSIEFQKDNPDSQVGKFIKFLDDIALSRVRLQVVMDLMTALAQQSNDPLLSLYVENIIQCYQLFASHTADTVIIDVSSNYGSRSNINLMQYFSNSITYTKLPIWAEPSIQLFENINENSHGFSAVRDISYRFKVNGKSAQAGDDKTAFLGKLDKLADRLLGEISENDSYTYDIAELIFLALVVPNEDASKNIPVAEKLTVIQEGIKKSPQEFLKKLHASLTSNTKIAVMDKIAKSLIKAIKEKSRQTIAALAKNNPNYILSINKEIINTEAIDSSDGEDNIDILKKSEFNKHDSLWLTFIKVLREDELNDTPALVSYKVNITIGEKTISAIGDLTPCRYQRQLSNAILPIRLMPITTDPCDAQNRQFLPSANNYQYISIKQGVSLPNTHQGGIEIYYWLKLLKRLSEQEEKELATKRNLPFKSDRMRGDQFHASCLVALNILLYITIHAIAERIKTLNSQPFHISILKFLTEYNGGDTGSDSSYRHTPNDIIYACSKALEKALCRDTVTRTQGIKEISLMYDTSGYIKKGFTNALLAGHSLTIPKEGALDKIAVIVYVTRPADTFPVAQNNTNRIDNLPTTQNNQGYLFTSKTFIADTQADNTMLVSVDNMRTHLIEREEDFDKPPILKEIARLSDLGYKDIVLISHHVNSRKIGRTANRHTTHLSQRFLEQSYLKFPDVNLYPLIREEFSAITITRRSNDKSGFEVIGLNNHQSLFDDYSFNGKRELLPIYSFATLHTVGGQKILDSRPQNGFSTYFFNSDARVDVDKQKAETIRANILGSASTDIQNAIVAVLRSLHFLECEKSVSSSVLLPVLDPFIWVRPPSIEKNGETLIMASKRKGKTQLSLTAILSHVSAILHKE